MFKRIIYLINIGTLRGANNLEYFYLYVWTAMYLLTIENTLINYMRLITIQIGIIFI